MHKILNLGFQNFRPIFLRVLVLVATLFCTYDYLFDSIFALLTFGDKGVRVLAEPFLKFEEMEYPIHYIKVEM